MNTTTQINPLKIQETLNFAKASGWKHYVIWHPWGMEHRLRSPNTPVFFIINDYGGDEENTVYSVNPDKNNQRTSYRTKYSFEKAVESYQQKLSAYELIGCNNITAIRKRYDKTWTPIVKAEKHPQSKQQVIIYKPDGTTTTIFKNLEIFIR